MDYMSHMKRRLTGPLVTLGADGARDVIETLDEYDLLREDFDNILESATWPGQRNPMEGVESKVRALRNGMWPVKLLYSVKFLKTSVSCTVIGYNILIGHKSFYNGFVKPAGLDKLTHLKSVFMTHV